MLAVVVSARALTTDLAIEVTLSPGFVPARRGSRPLAEQRVTAFTSFAESVTDLESATNRTNGWFGLN
jgi:hypothetical protein